jgi:hypothetical protein
MLNDQQIFFARLLHTSSSRSGESVMPRSVGISLDHGLAGAAVIEGVTRPRSAALAADSRLARPAAPALLFDPTSRRGARTGVRLEQAGETPLIGAGLDWPAASGFGGGLACPRVPIPLAISHICGTDAAVLQAGWPFEHRRGSEPTVMALEEILGRFLEYAADEVQGWSGSDAPRLVAAVPNAMPLRGMTSVIRAAGGKVRLIWRPVAALIGALDAHPEGFASLSEEDHVLVIHLGVDGYEGSLLHVIEHERRRGGRMRVPGRPRFVAGLTNVSVPLGGLLKRMVERKASGASVDVAESWARCWVAGGDPADGGVVWPVGPWARAESIGLGAWGWFCTQVRKDVAALHRDAAIKFRTECARMIKGSGRVRAIVVTGDLSASLSELVEAIASEAGRRIEPVASDSGIARGAAVFGWRESMGWPTYLDYLPQLRLFAERDGEGQWCEVVRSDWIDAGDEHSEIVHGFSIPEGTPGESSRTVPLAVALEGEIHVKATQDKISMPVDLATSRIPLDIRIKVQAATGDPRVTATPTNLPGLAGVTLDWSIATSTEETPDEYLKSRPRAYPPMEPVRASAWWSRNTDYRTISVQDEDRALFPGGGSSVTPCDYIRVVLRNSLTKDRLKKIRALAIRRYWDVSDLSWSAIASGDGQVQSHQEVLCELHAKLWDFLDPERRRILRADGPSRLDAIKVLAWTGFNERKFEGLILDRLDSDIAAIHGTGNGVRSAKGCAKAIRFLAATVKRKLSATTGEVEGVNEPLRQLSWILAQREDATSQLEDSEMVVALDAVLECARRLDKQGSRKVMFQWSIRCLVLMLSRRRFSVGFLDPSSPKAVDLIRFCADVYVKVARADDFTRELAKQLTITVPRYPVDPNPKVARFIRSFFEYIHRRGRDSLIVDDDG